MRFGWQIKVPAAAADAVTRPDFDTELQLRDGHKNYDNLHRSVKKMLLLPA